MSGLVSWMRRHRLAAFFVLAYALTWSTWPFQAAGLMSEPIIVSTGALIAALIVIGVTEGRPGWRDLGRRIVRWRVAWYWYVVALGLPLLVRLVATETNVALGAAGVQWAELSWSGFAAVFALRLVNPLEAPVSEEPAWRGYALPRQQSTRSPLASAVILGVLVAGWHLPLAVSGDLGLIGLPTTFFITIVYVWLFNHADGSVLLTLVFHAMEGSISYGDLGFSGADAERMNWIYGVCWWIVALALIVFDRSAWHVAPGSARYPVPASSDRSGPGSDRTPTTIETRA
ncbi:CPBP family intramembrane metalloprotease [Jiangella ureilytica]|uniref:CPBP family intramembrane metalloprotease n=1 Tax=Jiangella ureilytica TaxID=2530374 RepID=A0A4R4RUA9_9ACTN|nr:type II CAAX endopeptidase family protein [Jiangella ureilytica]TDC53236.1 CPBP family intramembrane metalloprotease [Jiangella ureilytica]